MSILARSSTLIIAEIGVNHDGSLKRAVELVEAAAEAGADAVKLQIFRARRLMHATASFAQYQAERCEERNPALMLEKFELSEGEVGKVVAAIRRAGLIPLATPFSLNDVGIIADLELPAVKIASPDLVNYPLLKKCAELGRPLLVSTGAAKMEEVEMAVSWLREWGIEFALLHCVSCYPTPAGAAHLGWIGQLMERFGVAVGYSDHTTELLAGALAVAAGARIVEKHLTYDTSARGPDHAASFDQAQFAEYVAKIRLAEKMRGSGSKRVLEIEEDVRGVSRQSLVAARDLPANHRVGEGDLTTQRPGGGIAAAQWGRIVGMKTRQAVAAGTMLTASMLAA